ncbi:hypothetical protein M9H77_13073 [Catharanthus roseus]|uniref:Uncharacterized protein n=1 Tax=Catharanthus roseus TaxID=4058 RepID=A0ACC0BJ48_CATRO|nr:hypothetical protein M9H77_13073 [Catharanthus roseus]
MGSQLIKAWSLMKQALMNRFEVLKHERQRQGRERIQSQSFNFLTTTCGTKSNHGMKAKGEGMGKELSIVGNCMVNPFNCEQALDIAHMFKSSSSCANLEKQLLDSVARIKLSYHDLELLHDIIFFDHIVSSFSSSCALTILSKIHIFLRSFVEHGTYPTVPSRPRD